MELCRIIGGLNPIGIGAAVRKSDYNELWQTGRWQLSDRWSTGGDPYGLCMDECLEVLVHPLTESSYDDHSKNALWLGTPVPMRLEILRPQYSETLLPSSQRS